MKYRLFYAGGNVPVLIYTVRIHRLHLHTNVLAMNTHFSSSLKLVPIEIITPKIEFDRLFKTHICPSSIHIAKMPLPFAIHITTANRLHISC